MRIKKRFIVFTEILALGLMVLTGCANRHSITQSISEEDQTADTNISTTSEAEDLLDVVAVPDNEADPDTEEENKNKKEERTFFGMPAKFEFASGAGAWWTDITISRDGSFVGHYEDSDMGDTGEGYPCGTQYICDFSGKFSNPLPTEMPHVYSMQLLELNIDTGKEIGSEEIIDEVLYVYSEPYGFDDADEFLIYLPGASTSYMTEECLSWADIDDSFLDEVPDGYYVIYNWEGREAFTATSHDSIWYRNFVYGDEEIYVRFTPSYYYGGSYLSFVNKEQFFDNNSLGVPWDGKSKEPIKCKDRWDKNSKIEFSVTIEPIEEVATGNLEFLISVECITNPEYDFSAWGSTEPGKFSGVLTERKKASED